MWDLRLRRWRWLRRSGVDERLQTIWAESLPKRQRLLEDVVFLVCDAEMSSLNPEEGEVLSLGWVRVEGGEISLNSARHCLVQNQNSVGQSATVHRLRDCELAAGGSLEDALAALLSAARGGVLVFHHAPLDMAFLNRAAKRCLGGPLLLPAVDTLALEKRLMERREQSIPQGALRLQACRERYGLPAHHAHNALTDALATAELLLAQCAARGPRLRLGDLL